MMGPDRVSGKFRDDFFVAVFYYLRCGIAVVIRIINLAVAEFVLRAGRARDPVWISCFLRKVWPSWSPDDLLEASYDGFRNARRVSTDWGWTYATVHRRATQWH